MQLQRGSKSRMKRASAADPPADNSYRRKDRSAKAASAGGKVGEFRASSSIVAGDQDGCVKEVAILLVSYFDEMINGQLY